MSMPQWERRLRRNSSPIRYSDPAIMQYAQDFEETFPPSQYGGGNTRKRVFEKSIRSTGILPISHASP